MDHADTYDDPDQRVITRRQLLAATAAGLSAVATGGPRARAAATDRSAAFLDDHDLTAPVVSAGMAFVAGPELVAAVSEAGGMGTLGASPLPPPEVARLIAHTRELTEKPFGVNLVVADGFPGSTVPFTTAAHVEVCARLEVPVVSFHWDLPQRAWVQALHAAGCRVWMQVGGRSDAEAAVALGVDALVAQGRNAGGHSKATEDLPRVLADVLSVAGGRPVLAAGGIATAGGVARALSAGAVAAWVGTRFVATCESLAHDEYKRRVVAAQRSSTVRTTLFGPEWPDASLRVLRNRVVEEWAGREHEVPTPPPPPLLIGTTTFAGTPYAMPKFSAVLPTRDTRGDFEEMALAAGGDAAASTSEVLPAAEVVRRLSVGHVVRRA